MPEYKTALLTIPKAGSQWIRDVLSAPQIAVNNDFFLVEPRETKIYPQKKNEDQEEWKKQWAESTGGSFFAPVYNIPSTIWRKVAATKDRAVVVLRDPRDMLVSWMYSQCYSHDINRITSTWRNLMLSIPLRSRIALAVLRFKVWEETYDSWAGQQNDSNFYVTSYENILNRQEKEFAKIIQFFGWDAIEDDVAKVVSDLSFNKRSGRKQGEENLASHYRKGIIGDWKNHFDQKTGKFFEALYPNLLKKLGYEKSENWYEGLKSDLEADENFGVNVSPVNSLELKAEIDRLNAKANEERLIYEYTIQSLTKEVNEKEEEINMLAIAAKDLQSQTELKDAEIKNLHGVCEERLRLIEFLDNELKNRANKHSMG